MIDIPKVKSFIMFQDFCTRQQNLNVKKLRRSKNYSHFEFCLELIRELGMIEKGALVPLYRNIRIPTEGHNVVPVPSATRRNCGSN